MSERDAFLRAICENPDDDTPRLVFADWLQENGDEARAEFIRVQIEAARLTADDDRLDGLVRRANELQKLFGNRWLGELPVPDPGHIDWVKTAGSWVGGEPFDRGFAGRLWVKTAGVLAKHANELFTATPVRRLMIWHIMKADKLARLPQLRHLHTFRARIVSRRAADELAECQHLDSVPDVRLSLTALPEEYVERLRKRFGNRLQNQP
jgi:uncharacterized protein (TIGR02996 family)